MRTINGQLLKEMLISGSNNLYNHYPEIDALNVFPVPDGDTGMNMNLTLTSGAKEIQNRNDEDVYTIANLFSRGLLMGARGNSGVITSQIFRGFASSLKEKKVINSLDLVDAFSNGSKVAYKAVMRPVEGTILTVIREACEALNDKVDESFSIEKTTKLLLDQARISLEHTPELLPVLKEVGVVDSGGAGLVKILEGINSVAHGKFIEKKEIVVASEQTPTKGEGYLMEFDLLLGEIGDKKSFVSTRFISNLKGYGNDVNVEQNDKLVHVSILTLSPGSVFTYAQNFGEFDNIIISNLSLKNSNTKEDKEEVYTIEKESAIVAVSSGKGIDDYFLNIGVDKIVSGGQTMNPSTEDIISAIRSTRAKTVYVLPNNSNIVMASFQAADVLTDEIDVRVITTKTIPQGIAAASTFNPDASADENVEAMKESYANLRSGAITYAIKDTIVDGIQVYKNYYMGLFDKKIVVCEKNKINSLYKLLDQMVDDECYLVTIFVGEDVNSADLELIKNELPNKYPNVEFDISEGKQPVYSFLLGVE